MELAHAYEQTNHIRTWSNDRIKRDGSVDRSFPYPDKYVRSTATGELADRLRFALSNGRPETIEYEPVFLTETTKYGGYSEYTQDNLTYIKVECGVKEVVFQPDFIRSAFAVMLDWLDETERPYNMTPAQIKELIEFAEKHGWTGPQDNDETDQRIYGW